MNSLANIIHVSLLSIMKNKRRNIFTMIGIIIGIAAVITIMSLGNGFKKTANEEFSNAGASKGAALINYFAKDPNAPNRDPFTESDMELARQVKGVKDARVKEDDTFGLSSKASTEKKETDIAVVKKTSVTSPEEGEGFTEDDNLMENRVATISSNVADELFKGNAVGKTIYIDGMGFEVVGIQNNGQIQNAVSIPTRTVKHYLPNLKPDAPQLEILFDEKQNKKKIANQVAKKLNQSGSAAGLGEYQYTDLEEMMKSIGKIFDSITYFVAAVAGISLFIAGIGVMNVMYISVAERTEEIAIRRAFGAKSRHIEFQFLIESVILCLIGGIIGLLLGILLASLVDALTPEYIKSAVSLGSILLAVGVSTLIGVVFGWIPARSASKKELIDIIK
ncbi:ABC transporter permease [Staphylococcus muscae]|uniref:ABC transporter permease n=1 Tax=Staphylococcus muscae TaxID=1294 RepID=A0A240C8X2_9STAP|nr:ABC transporter permease [Staphylococcus muscae]AVQ33844.1 ABC transporter permease [Staphylococcus muscae]PNZ06159.1 ABC transporter permease [Staphylococcus muscae]GGA94991.1 ABC transporter permease [Staphylococcus muscae]SNW04427.1 ABC transporter permease [Staphylococcus muscae]